MKEENVPNFKNFEKHGSKYLADVDTGFVVKIDEIMASLLEEQTDEKIRELEKEYYPFEIIEAIKKLNALQRLGAISFKEKEKKAVLFTEPRVLSLFISPGFLYELSGQTFVNRMDIYSLLSALTQKANLFLGFPEGDEQDTKDEKRVDFDVEGIHKVKLPVSSFVSWTRFIPSECDGILSLSSGLKKEMAFFCDRKFPLICQIKSNEKLKKGILQSTMEKSSLFRPYDALLCDASWTKDALIEIAPTPSISIINNGVDSKLFRPIDQQAAKANLAKAFDNPGFLDKKTVILFTGGFYPENRLSFLEELNTKNEDLLFLVIDSSVSIRRNSLKTEEIEYYQVEDVQDFEALPFVFNAADIAFLPAVLGISPTLVFSAMACGVPMVVVGENSMPEEIREAGVFIQSEKDAYGDLIVPADFLCEKIKWLLEHEQKRQELSKNAKRKASVFTWKKAAEQILELFYQSYQKFGKTKPIQRLPVRFFRHYDKGTECVYSKAVRAFSGRELPLSDALAFSLRRQHTPMEVLIVLRYLFSEEKAKEVFERVFTEGGEKNG